MDMSNDEKKKVDTYFNRFKEYAQSTLNPVFSISNSRRTRPDTAPHHPNQDCTVMLALAMNPVNLNFQAYGKGNVYCTWKILQALQ